MFSLVRSSDMQPNPNVTVRINVKKRNLQQQQSLGSISILELISFFMGAWKMNIYFKYLIAYFY